MYVTRADGTSTGWDFPSYGDGLPHDMCHLVVEDELKLPYGFWGLIDQGGEIEPINGEATLAHNGKPLVEMSGSDFAGLIQAEAVVAALAGPGGSVSDSAAVLPCGPSLKVYRPSFWMKRPGCGGGSGYRVPTSWLVVVGNIIIMGALVIAIIAVLTSLASA